MLEGRLSEEGTVSSGMQEEPVAVMIHYEENVLDGGATCLGEGLGLERG